MYKYAQINENGICVSVSYLSGEVNAEHMIPLDDSVIDDIGLLGKKREDEAWVTMPQPEFEVMPDKVSVLEEKITALETQLQALQTGLVEKEVFSVMEMESVSAKNLTVKL